MSSPWRFMLGLDILILALASLQGLTIFGHASAHKYSYAFKG